MPYPDYEYGRNGLLFVGRPSVECDWNLASTELRQSTRFLRLPSNDERGNCGIGDDFLESKLIYIHPSDDKKQLSEIGFRDDYLPCGHKFINRALFLDRDGILIEDTDYPGKIADVRFREDICPVLDHFHKENYLLIVVTNQSGIARGYYTQEDFFQTTEYIGDHFQKRGYPLRDTFHCPYHPQGTVPEFSRQSGYRKPAPGMVLAAASKHKIDLSRSLMLGDNETDRLAVGALKSYTVGKETSDFPRVADFLNFAQQHFS